MADDDPFGVPVEPDVYMTYAVLPGLSGAIRSSSTGLITADMPSVSASSRSNTRQGMSLSGKDAAVAVSVRSRSGAASVRMKAVRALG